MVRGKKKEELTLEEKLEQALVPVEEQPYEVPENWCWVRLGSISQVVGGGTPSTSHKEYYENGNIPWISPADLSRYEDKYISGGARMITELGLNKSSARLLPQNTVCLSTRAPIGYVVIAENQLSTNQGFKNFFPSPVYMPEYLYWYLKGNKEFLEEKASGTTFRELSMSKVSKIEFPLPPIQEQRRIVDRIESLFAKLDEAKEKVQEVIDGYAIRETTILQKAVSGELTKGWREKNGISKKAWKVISLKECGNWFGGGTPAKSKNVYWDGGTIPWITSKDMKDRLVEDSLLHITQEGVNHSSAQYCDKPAVLFVMRSGILRRILPVCMVKVPFTVNQDLKAVIPEKIQLEYMYWACTAYEKDIRENCMKSGTTVESIEAKKLFEYELPLPDEREQKVIVGVIENLMCKEESAKQLAVQILKRIDIMKKSILAKVFRGELGTNNLEEESSVKLLKTNIRAKRDKVR
ncbi:MAG: restriction endonuclease subunit S [Eubacterium sp.]|nr:restriction endonuclease subunit S [Eubacterium sp.]